MKITTDTMKSCINAMAFSVDGKMGIEIRQDDDKKEYVFEIYKLPFDDKTDIIKTVKVPYKKLKVD